MSIIVFSDGSCFGNGKKNAIAGMGVHFPNKELPDLSVPFTIKNKTNQRAELGAIYLTLKYLKQNYEDELKNKKICIYTDSKYSIMCLEKYIHVWEKNGWLTAKKEPVLNQDLLKSIHKYMLIFNVSFIHVYGHKNDESYNTTHNNVADKLATNASRQQKII